MSYSLLELDAYKILHASGLKTILNIICYIVPIMLHTFGTNNSATLHAPGLRIIINIICNIAPTMLHA